jgi:hypothetical protein
MLDSHPELAIPPESYFLVALAKRRRLAVKKPVFDLERFITALLGHRRFSLWGLPPDRVRAVLERRAPTTFSGAFRAIYALYADEQGKPRYGDKTPWYVHHISFLKRMFPEARFLHVVRDGRDVILSQRKEAVTGAMVWRGAIRAGQRASRLLGPESYMDVRYEELVPSPEKTLRSVCRFVSIPFRSEMLEYHLRADEIRAGFVRSGSPAHRRIGEPPRLRPDGWHQRMTASDVARFELIAGRELAACGYGLSADELPRGDALRVRVAAHSLGLLSIVRRGSRGIIRRLGEL